MVFYVDKDVPIPAKRGRKTMYNFEDLNVGDSMFIPNKKTSTVSSALCTFKRRKGIETKFIVRQEQDGCRVWRTE